MVLHSDYVISPTGMDMDPDTSRAVYEVYQPLDSAGSLVDPPLEPLR